MNQNKAIKCYQEAIVLQQKGMLVEAERAYRKAIKANPKFVEAYNNIGNVLLDLGQLREATVAFRKAQNILPKHPMLNHNMGNVLQMQGELDKAVNWYNKAIGYDSSFVGSHINLGNALRDLRRFDEAVKAYRRAIEVNPAIADTYNNLGSLLIDMAQFDAAVEEFLKAIKIDPAHIEAYNGLGNALSALEKPQEAVKAYQRGIEINPQHKDAYNGLGNVLSDLSETDDAIATYQQAIKISPDNTEAYNGLGNAYSDQGNLDEAVAAYRRAIEIDPRHIAAHIGIGKAMSDFGEIEEAIKALRDSLNVDPDNADTYRCIAKNKKFSEFDEDARQMEALYERSDTSDDSKMHLAFGLGKIYEDLREYEKSMDFILQAAKFKRATLDYTIVETIDFFSRLKQVFNAEFISSRQSSGNPDSTPIFILGMPRSGTSLAEQILASHPLVFGAGELSDLARLTETMVSAESGRQFPESVADASQADLIAWAGKYIDKLRRHSKDATFITDKMPHNFRYVGLIHILLPNAKIINCTRDPMDNCLSIFKNYFASSHDYSYDLTELGEYYNSYLDLMAYWNQTLPGVIYNLNYETLVSDQESQVRQLLEYCDLPWDDTCLSFHKKRRKVKTASNAQVRQPIYQDSVKLWKRFEKQLEPLRTAIDSE